MPVLPDYLQNAFFLSECLVVPAGIFLFVLIPGYAITNFLKLDLESTSEKISFYIALGSWSILILAFSVFLTDSNFLWYVYSGFFFIYAFWILFKAISQQRLNIREIFENAFCQLKKPIVFVYIGLLFIIGLYIYPGLISGKLLWDPIGKVYLVSIDWDAFHALSALNELRNGFLPKDNPDLPGVHPYFHHWLGRLLPAFLIKCLKIDQIHASLFWAPLILILGIIPFLHFFAKRLTGDHWTALFCVGGLFFFPLTLHYNLPPSNQAYYTPNWHIRSLTGALIIFSTMIFLRQYVFSKRQIYIALSFIWSFLLFVKPIYMVVMIPGVALFYGSVIFDKKNLNFNKKLLKLVLICSILPLCLYWISNFFFAPYFMSTGFFNLDLSSIKIRGMQLFQKLGPPGLFYIFYYYKKLKNRNSFSPFETFIWVTFFSGVLLCLLCPGLVRSNILTVLEIGLIAFLPVIVKKYFQKQVMVNRVFGGILSISIFMVLSVLSETTKPYYFDTLTVDEMRMISFLKNKTPVDSVILYNMPRFFDRPAIMSSLTYRKSFIDEGERMANTYNVILQKRLYNVWNFFHCDCNQNGVERFLSHYPNLDYLVVYHHPFFKVTHPLVGLHSLNTPVRVKALNHFDGFQEVFHSGKVKVFKINRKTISETS